MPLVPNQESLDKSQSLLLEQLAEAFETTCRRTGETISPDTEDELDKEFQDLYSQLPEARKNMFILYMNTKDLIENQLKQLMIDGDLYNDNEALIKQLTIMAVRIAVNVITSFIVTNVTYAMGGSLLLGILNRAVIRLIVDTPIAAYSEYCQLKHQFFGLYTFLINSYRLEKGKEEDRRAQELINHPDKSNSQIQTQTQTKTKTQLELPLFSGSLDKIIIELAHQTQNRVKTVGQSKYEFQKEFVLKPANYKLIKNIAKINSDIKNLEELQIAPIEDAQTIRQIHSLQRVKNKIAFRQNLLKLDEDAIKINLLIMNANDKTSISDQYFHELVRANAGSLLRMRLIDTLQAKGLLEKFHIAQKNRPNAEGISKYETENNMHDLYLLSEQEMHERNDKHKLEKDSRYREYLARKTIGMFGNNHPKADHILKLKDIIFYIDIQREQQKLAIEAIKYPLNKIQPDIQLKLDRLNYKVKDGLNKYNDEVETFKKNVLNKEGLFELTSENMKLLEKYPLACLYFIVLNTTTVEDLISLQSIQKIENLSTFTINSLIRPTFKKLKKLVNAELCSENIIEKQDTELNKNWATNTNYPVGPNLGLGAAIKLKFESGAKYLQGTVPKLMRKAKFKYVQKSVVNIARLGKMSAKLSESNYHFHRKAEKDLQIHPYEKLIKAEDEINNLNITLSSRHIKSLNNSLPPPTDNDDNSSKKKYPNDRRRMNDQLYLENIKITSNGQKLKKYRNKSNKLMAELKLNNKVEENFENRAHNSLITNEISNSKAMQVLLNGPHGKLGLAKAFFNHDENKKLIKPLVHRVKKSKYFSTRMDDLLAAQKLIVKQAILLPVNSTLQNNVINSFEQALNL